jgi:3D-(3,5/4)-trihydroxycyclohexane-1,2-dione acylhydrolase (decyclizing)
VTSIQEGCKLTIVLMDNDGFKSIGGLSRSLGQTGFGTRYVFPVDGALPGDEVPKAEALPVDLASNAESLGAVVFRCTNHDDFASALEEARKTDRTTVLYIKTDRYENVPGYESWWDVPVAEVSESETVAEARREWEEGRRKERYYLRGAGQEVEASKRS